MQNQENPSVDSCPTHLIADQVAEDDAFGHHEIAGAIADMILHEDRGCAIALTGAWGSGKSTVVELLRNALKKDDTDIGTFVFDAWAHQGDPLRRTFLEKIIHYCIERPGWIANKSYWLGVIEELAKRKERTETDSSPKLTKLGAFAAISLLLAPAALQVYLKNEFQYHHLLTRAALFFGALPALIAVCATIYWGIKKRANPEEEHPLAGLFYTSSATKTTTTSSKTIDPTSVEFECRYRELLTEVLGDNRRRILIVVDNLDRVNHDDARSMWASMRVFFDPSTSRATEWRSRVWVLVPFDPDAIENLWDVRSNTTNGNQVSHHFLEKTFQATFRVPPVILSNRREYLLSQLRAAFPSHADAEFHNIFRLYDRLAANGKEPPTPRSIKIFVNKLGSIHRQWQHRVPFAHQAGFVLWAEQNENVLSVIPTSGPPALLPNLPATIGGLLDDEWPRNFAALYFNVAPEEAYQVLLWDPIRKAIQARDATGLSELEQSSGFPEVMESTIEDLCGASTNIDSALVADAALALSHLKGNWQGFENCKAHLCRIALSFKEWEPFDGQVAEGIKSLIQMMPTTSDISPLIRGIANSLRLSNRSTLELGIANWCAGLSTLIPVLDKMAPVALKRDFRVEAEPEDYLEVIKKVEQGPNADLIIPYLMPADGLEPVFEHLSSSAANGKWNEYAATAVKSLLKIDSEFGCESLIEAFRSRIITSHTYPEADLPGMLESVLYLSFSHEKARELLENAAKAGSLIQILGLLSVNENLKSAAACILPLLGNEIPVQPVYRPQPNTVQWSITQGTQIVLALIQNPKSNQALVHMLGWACLGFHEASRWREISEERPEQKQLISDFLAIRLRGEEIGDLETEEIVENVEFWRSALGTAEFARAVDLKARAGELSAALMDQPFDLAAQDLYAVALDKDNGAEYREFLCDGLNQLTEDQWSEELHQETELVGIAIQLKGAGLTLAQAFQDALAAHAESRFSEEGVGELSSVWDALPALLSNEGQAVLNQRLWNSFNSESGRIKGVIPYYGELLSTVVRKFGPETAFKRIIQVINDHEESEINWLKNTLSRWTPRSKEAKASQGDWRNRVERALSEESQPLTGEERLALTAFQDVLGPKTRPSKSRS